MFPEKVNSSLLQHLTDLLISQWFSGGAKAIIGSLFYWKPATKPAFGGGQISVSRPIQLRLDPLRFHQEGVFSWLLTSDAVFSTALVHSSLIFAKWASHCQFAQWGCVFNLLVRQHRPMFLWQAVFLLTKPGVGWALFAARVTPGPCSALCMPFPSSSAAELQFCPSLPSCNRCRGLSCPSAPPAPFLCWALWASWWSSAPTSGGPSRLRLFLFSCQPLSSSPALLSPYSTNPACHPCCVTGPLHSKPLHSHQIAPSKAGGGPKGAGRRDALLWESLSCPHVSSPVPAHPLQILHELGELLGCQTSRVTSLAALQPSPGGTMLDKDWRSSCLSPRIFSPTTLTHGLFWNQHGLSIFLQNDHNS